MQNLHLILERVVERGEDLSIVYFSSKTLKLAYNKLRTRGACFLWISV